MKISRNKIIEFKTHTVPFFHFSGVERLAGTERGESGGRGRGDKASRLCLIRRDRFGASVAASLLAPGRREISAAPEGGRLIRAIILLHYVSCLDLLSSYF